MRSVQQPGERPCTLRPSTTCSPSQVFTIVFYEKVFLKNQQICVVQGPCCTESCQLRYGVKCRDDNGCRDAAFCDGTGPRCPPSNNKANKTVCNEEFVCFMGVSFFFFPFLTTFRDFISWQQQQQECTGSICIAYGLQSCQCLQGPNDPPTKACELCCKLPGDDQPCL